MNFLIWENLKKTETALIFKQIRVLISQRQRIDLTIIPFAEAMHIGVSSISEYEKGKKKPSWKCIQKLLLAGNVTEGEFTGLLLPFTEAEAKKKVMNIQISLHDLMSLFTQSPEALEWAKQKIPQLQELLNPRMRRAYYEQALHPIADDVFDVAEQI